eukprot:4907493-Amphidinium_carterae.3
MEKCNPSTTPGKKKPPIAMYRTAVGQLLCVSQLSVDIAFEVKELSRSLQQPDNEDLKNLKQLLRYIKGTTYCTSQLHQKLNTIFCQHLAKVEHNEQGQIKVHIESSADSDWAGYTTRKSTSGTITKCWNTPLLHISRTQSTVTLSSAEAELYAMGQATIEAQHIKQVIEEMAVPYLSTHITMSINTDSSAGKAVASRLGLNKKTKHVQVRFLYIQDIVQCGQLTLTEIPTTHNPADVLTKHLPTATIQSHLDRLCLQTTTTDLFLAFLRQQS